MAKRTAPKPQQFGPRYNRQPKAKIQRHASTHTTYTGKPKTGYLTLERAQEVANRPRLRAGAVLRPYRCIECGLWHIGKDARTAS
jgi:hypothetical protein